MPVEGEIQLDESVRLDIVDIVLRYLYRGDVPECNGHAAAPKPGGMARIDSDSSDTPPILRDDDGVDAPTIEAVLSLAKELQLDELARGAAKSVLHFVASPGEHAASRVEWTAAMLRTAQRLGLPYLVPVVLVWQGTDALSSADSATSCSSSVLQ